MVNYYFKRINATVLITVAAFLSGYAQSYSWKQKADFGSSARYATFSFAIGNFGYIGGGYDGTTYNDLWQYNPLTNSWTQKSNPPVGVRVASTFVISGLGYVTNGVTPFGYMADLWEYNPVANNWQVKTPCPGTARFGGAAFAIGNKGYFGTGCSGSAFGPFHNDFYEYDQVNNSWTQKANFPGQIRYGTFGIALNGKGYLGFGTYNPGNVTQYNDWWEYDPLQNSWLQKANYPGIVRDYPAGFMINGKIYVGTGNNMSLALNDFYEYDQALNSWTQKQNYGAGNRWVVACFAIGNTGYFGTGYDFTNFYNEFWEYSPDATGIQEALIDENFFTVYPNPFSNELYFETGTTADVVKIKMYNVSGKLIFQQNFSNRLIDLTGKVSGLENGVYFISVGKQSVKLLKE